MDQEKLKMLALSMEITMSKDRHKELSYIEFLKKHNLPNSGPTPKLLSSLNKSQKIELTKIFS